MGADFLLAALVIDTKKTPDWVAARTAVEAMTLQELVDVQQGVTGSDEFCELDDPEYNDEEKAKDLASLREKMLGVVTYCAEAVAGQNRLCSHIQVRGANVYIVGAPSWGDAPEGTEEFLLFLESPAYEAAGFEHQVFVQKETHG